MKKAKAMLDTRYWMLDEIRCGSIEHPESRIEYLLSGVGVCRRGHEATRTRQCLKDLCPVNTIAIPASLHASITW